MHKLTSSIFGLVVALVLGLGIQYVVAVGTWTAPTQTPPNGNVDAPINAGSSAQAKLGVLSLGKATTPTTGSTLDVNGIGLFQGLITSAFQLTTGAGAGKVLTSDANGVGSWASPASSGGSGQMPSVWGYLSGPGTLARGYNISSVTYINGITRVTFTNPLPDTNYAVITTRDTYGFNGDGGIYPYTKTTTYVEFVSSNQGNGSYSVVSGFSFLIL